MDNNFAIRKIWPIKASEFFKFSIMTTLMFSILLSHNTVRVLKDSLIINNLGAEAISFIKLWLEIPTAALFVFIYCKLCNIMTTEKVFRVIIISFLIFFLVFTFILYPYRNYLHLDPDLVNYYITHLPHLKWFIIILGKWGFTLFYIVGELWPVVVFTLLFWQLANKIVNSEEAQRFYPFFNFFGQLNLLFVGMIVSYFVQKNHCLSFLYGHLEDKTEITLKSLTTVVVISGIITLSLHYIIERRILYGEHVKDNVVFNKKVLTLGIIESFKRIFASKYLIFICILIISYSISVSLVEGIWFAKVKVLYPTIDGFMNYQGKVLFWTGVFGIFAAFTGSIIIRNFGWFNTAMVTPLIILLVGTVFFIVMIAQDEVERLFVNSPINLLGLIVFLGGLQNVLGKGIKYGLFDTTKEMLYIPLDNEIKTKGKAAVDVIGAKCGKALGSLVQFLVFTILPAAKIENIISILMVVFIFVCLIWMLAVKNLSIMYRTLSSNEPK